MKNLGEHKHLTAYAPPQVQLAKHQRVVDKEKLVWLVRNCADTIIVTTETQLVASGSLSFSPESQAEKPTN
jgi:hypothetical protein